MAHSEACELFIEQSIDEAVQEGKKPAEIGRELSEWIAKLFETKLAPRTLEQKARRRPATTVANNPTPRTSSQSPQSNEIKRQAKDGTHRGGSRPGSGRKPYKLKRTLGDTGHPGDPIVAEYEATIKGLNEKLTLVKESKDKRIQELEAENRDLQAENSAFRLELKELKESAPPPPSVNGLHLKLEKLEAENERLQGELATAMEMATAPQIAAI